MHDVELVPMRSRFSAVDDDDTLLLYLSLTANQLILKLAPQRDGLRHQRQLWSAKCVYDDVRRVFRDSLLQAQFLVLIYGR